jgi:hypothetical protein
MLRKFVSVNRNSAKWFERKFPRVFLSPSYKHELENRIQSDITTNRPPIILEVGGIDRPLLTKSSDYCYIGLDIEEQPDCYQVYDKFIVQSIEDPVDVQADMVISITLLEHVPNNVLAIRTMYDALNPGGGTHHYVPSKWHPYSVILRIVGPKLQKKLIAVLRPDAADVTGYPAFFDHCSASEMRSLMVKQGFVDVDVKPFYRASDYFAFFLPAYIAVTLFENFCSKFEWSVFASGFVVSAKKTEL